MAKVISWALNGKFVYLGSKDGSVQPSIVDEEKSTEETSELAYEWRNASEDEYKDAFAIMSGMVRTEIGITDLTDYRKYYNVFAEDSVYLITGKDGKNTYDTGSSYYTLHLLNDNIALGLGGNHILDVPATVSTELYAERDGIYCTDKIAISAITSENGDVTYEYSSERSDRYWKINISIPAGTEFDPKVPLRLFIKTVSVDASVQYSGETIFTVTGFKDGGEGTYYNLVVTPKIVKKIGNVYSANIISAYCVANGVVISNSNINIKYKIGEQPEAKYTTGVSTQDIYTSGGTCEFFLYVSGGENFIDSDTCTIVEDGTNGTDINRLELGNEMDGIGLGGDNILNTPSVVGTNLIAYKGSEKLLVKSVEITGDADNDNFNSVEFFISEQSVGTVNFSNSVSKKEFEEKTDRNVSFNINLGANFSLTENLRREYIVKVEAYSVTDLATPLYLSGKYVLVGIHEGKDGVVYKLITNCNSVIYDPNKIDDWKFSETELSVSATVNYVDNEGLEIYWSKNNSYNYKDTEGLTPYTGPITSNNTDVFNIDTEYIAFHLFSGNTFLDREAIPFLHEGTDKSPLRMELFNDVEAVGVGNDNILDVETECTTEFGLYSGDTNYLCSSLVKIESTEAADNVYGRIVFSNGYESDLVFLDGMCEIAPIGSYSGAVITLNFQNGFTFDSASMPFAISIADAGIIMKKTFSVVPVRGGEDGIVYRVVPSVNVIQKDKNYTGETIPAEISCEAYEGLFPIIVDGETWEIRYGIDGEGIETVYSEPINTGQIETFIDFGLFFNNGEEWNLIDKERVPVVINGADGKDGEKGDPGKDGKDGKDGTSPYFLDISNENIGFNCDSNGNILPGAYKPRGVTATLKYGNSTVRGATYSMPNASLATGVSINASSGVISFGDDLSFNGYSIELFVIASTGGTVVASKTLSLIKNMAGTNGADAVTYWLVPSADSVVVNSDGTIENPKITCKAYKQVGQNTPVIAPDSEVKIYYGYTTSQFNDYNNAGITVDIEKSCLYLSLKTAGTHPVEDQVFDSETIPIIKNGKSGRAGAAIRGPYDWDNTRETDREFCNGEEPHSEFIDIILKADREPSSYVLSLQSKEVVILCDENFSPYQQQPKAYIDGQIVYETEYDISFKAYNGVEEAMDVTYEASSLDEYSGIIVDTENKLIHVNLSEVDFDAEIEIDIAAYKDEVIVCSDSIKFRKVVDTQETGKISMSASTDVIRVNEYGEILDEYVTISTFSYYHNATNFQQDILMLMGYVYDTDYLSHYGIGSLRIHVPSSSHTYLYVSTSIGGSLKIPFIVEPKTVGEPKYYRCKTSYVQESGASWESVKENWMEADGKYDFIASNLILAKSAKINFLSGNEIYLGKEKGEITAGISGNKSTDGSSIAFWAGSENPISAPYKVTHNGSVSAETGYFNGEIHATSGTFNGEIHATSGTFNGSITASTLTLSGSSQLSLCQTNSDNISAGARGKVSQDSDVAFWAGSSDPNNGKFKVDHGGNLSAETGVFGGSLLMKYIFLNSLPIDSSNCFSVTGMSIQNIVYRNPDGIAEDTLYIKPANSSTNGLMYNFIITPMMTKSDYGSHALLLKTRRTDSNDGYFIVIKNGTAETYEDRWEQSDSILLMPGSYQFVCTPFIGNVWLLFTFNGEVKINGKTYKSYPILTT